MECPFCGKTGNPDATYCDHCGKRLDEGARSVNFPPFYERATYGLTFEHLLSDYERHLFPDDGLSDCWVGRASCFGSRFRVTEDYEAEWGVESQKVYKLYMAMGERSRELEDLAPGSVEGKCLSAISDYLRIYERCRPFKVEDSKHAISRLRELEGEAEAIPAECREGFIERYRRGVQDCEELVSYLTRLEAAPPAQPAKSKAGCLSMFAVVGAITTISACAWIAGCG